MSREMTRQGKSDPPSGEYSNFENALKKVLSVPRSEMQKKLEHEKKRKESKQSSASHVSNAEN
jgi:hypothetical protein